MCVCICVYVYLYWPLWFKQLTFSCWNWMLGVVSGRLEFKLDDVFFHAYSYREKACLSNFCFRFNEIKFRSLFVNLTPLIGVLNIILYYIIIRCPWNTDLLLLSAPSYMCCCLWNMWSNCNPAALLFKATKVSFRWYYRSSQKVILYFFSCPKMWISWVWVSKCCPFLSPSNEV